MIQKYNVNNFELLFDDQKCIKDLIQTVFDSCGYYEPLGMEIVTIFQAHSSRSNCGWFTTNTSLRCCDEIEDNDWIFFAYHMPGKFYYAEGGWGHHMPSLGNHPIIKDPVPLSLKFNDENHTIVIAGKYTFIDIFRFLKKATYISDDADRVIIQAVNPYHEPYELLITHPLMGKPIIEFEKELPNSVVNITIM